MLIREYIELRSDGWGRWVGGEIHIFYIREIRIYKIRELRYQFTGYLTEYLTDISRIIHGISYGYLTDISRNI